MQTIALKRITSTGYGTFGVLLIDKVPYCVTLEPIDPIIPIGLYICSRYKSPHFKTDVFTIENVPNHTAIEIHIGNVLGDTHGCILIAQYFANNGIANSRMTFDNFMLDFPDNKIMLEVLS